MSAAKKKPPPFAMKFEMLTPVAEVTVNVSGPMGLPAWPPVQVVQVTDSRKAPNAEAESGAGPIAKMLDRNRGRDVTGRRDDSRAFPV